MSYIIKRIKYTIIQLEIVINIIFKQVLIVFKCECSDLECNYNKY